MSNKSKKTTPKPAPKPAVTPADIRKLLGDDRIESLSNQAACEVNGGIERVLQNSCACAAGMYKDDPAALAAQGAIITIQACGSKPTKQDVEILLKATAKKK